MVGFGRYFWVNSDKIFLGFLKNNKRNGFGIVYWKKKNKLEIGFFADSIQIGVSKIYEKNLATYCFYDNGQKVKQKMSESEAFAALLSDQKKYKKVFLAPFSKLKSWIE